MDPNQTSDQPNQDLILPPEDTLMTVDEPATAPAPDQVSYTPPQAWGSDESTSPVGATMTPSPTSSATPAPAPAVQTPSWTAPQPTNPPVQTTTTTTTINPTQPITKSKGTSPFIRTFLIAIALILLGIFIGVLAARFLPPVTLGLVPATAEITRQPTSSVIASDSAAIQETPTVEITPIPIPTATPAALLKLKWNIITVKSPVSFDSSYRISYPTTWVINEYKNIPSASDSGYSSLILAKGKTTLSITQGAGDGPTCFYPNDNTYHQEMFDSFGSYREMAKGNISWRWAQLLSSVNPPTYFVCEYKLAQDYFNEFTTVGIVKITGNNLSPADLDEINYILEKIVILK